MVDGVVVDGIEGCTRNVRWLGDGLVGGSRFGKLDKNCTDSSKSDLGGNVLGACGMTLTGSFLRRFSWLVRIILSKFRFSVDALGFLGGLEDFIRMRGSAFPRFFRVLFWSGIFNALGST